MFSVAQKREIAEQVQTTLRATNHPELPKGEIKFCLHVDGAESWSWADIQNNGAITDPSVNPHNERQDPEARVAEGAGKEKPMSENVTREEANHALWAEVQKLLAQLDRGGSFHWLLGLGDGKWRIVHGHGSYKPLGGPQTPFLSLLETRDKLRERVSPPAPEEPQAAEEGASEIIKLTRAIDVLEKGVANRGDAIDSLCTTIKELRKTSVPKATLREFIDRRGSW